MRAINHALTGALIGLTVTEPAFAVPAAFVSHFVCDSIPHYGAQKTTPKMLRAAFFRQLLYVDAVMCFALVAVLAASRPAAWLLAAVCAFAAASPDFLWIPRYRRALLNRPWRPGPFTKFAGDIQWFQRPIGAAVDLAWFAVGVVLLANFL